MALRVLRQRPDLLLRVGRCARGSLRFASTQTGATFRTGGFVRSMVVGAAAVGIGISSVSAFSIPFFGSSKHDLPVGPETEGLVFEGNASEVDKKIKRIFTGGERFENDETKPMRERMQGLVLRLQREICSGLEGVEAEAAEEDGATPKRFQQDLWERAEGGGGLTRVLQDGRVFEKAGVAVSAVHGRLTPAAIRMMNSRGKDIPMSKDKDGNPVGPRFFACGVSLVIHPRNPHAPTSHANYRYFEIVDEDGKEITWWFGGGSDLTPSYLYEEDARYFHQTIAKHVERGDGLNGETFYRNFKKWCDDYFRITHRGESRGVGGIFFDDLSFNAHDKDGAIIQENKANEEDKEDIQKRRFKLMQNVGESFVPSYVPIVRKRRSLPFTEEERRWQQLRRGRYVEFNLVYDRGTKFGLQSGGRVESILMSLPLTARFEYCHVPEEGSREEALLKVLREPRDWI